MNHLRLPSIGVAILAAVGSFLAVASLGGESSARWVRSWACSQQIVEVNNSLPPVSLRDGTLRQIVHLSIGGSTLRVQLSNRFGEAPLRIDSVHLARSANPASAKIVNGSDMAVRFFSHADVTIPAGAEFTSDPVSMAVTPQADLAITLHMEDQLTHQTGHPGSRATSYVVPGNHVAEADFESPLKIEHWYFLSGIDVEAPATAAAVVALGDSITDGHGATTNGTTVGPTHSRSG